jgi:hypothetical protein
MENQALTASAYIALGVTRSGTDDRAAGARRGEETVVAVE